MTKDELEKHIQLYKETEDIVMKLDSDYGISLCNMGPSSKNNFYNNYNLIIHNLLVSIFGDLKTDLIEEYAFDQWPEMTFDDLCNKLEI